MSDTAQLWLFVAYVVAVITAMADVYTTMVGREHGIKESNFLMRWFADHYLAGAGLKALAIPLALVLLSKVMGSGATVALAIVGVGAAVTSVRNYLLLRKWKISLK